MRLVNYSRDGGPLRVGVMDAQHEKVRDLGTDATSVDDLLVDGLFPEGQEPATAAGTPLHDLADVVLHPPVRSPGKIIGVGLNYQDHADEVGASLPTEPVFFAKFANTLIGPEGDIVLPAVSEQVDWEAELVAVIGRTTRHVSESEALDHVVGYTVGNDISARDWQLGKPMRQWTIGKTFDTFLPLGPALVTADEIVDPHKLAIRCSVNGETVQDSVTDLYFTVPQLVAYLSRVMTLEAGDLILTGTPAGVGMSAKPPQFLKSGDVLVTTIEGIGSLRNTVTAEGS